MHINQIKAELTQLSNDGIRELMFALHSEKSRRVALAKQVLQKANEDLMAIEREFDPAYPVEGE